MRKDLTKLTNLLAVKYVSFWLITTFILKFCEVNRDWTSSLCLSKENLSLCETKRKMHLLQVSAAVCLCFHRNAIACLDAKNRFVIPDRTSSMNISISVHFRCRKHWVAGGKNSYSHSKLSVSGGKIGENYLKLLQIVRAKRHSHFLITAISRRRY